MAPIPDAATVAQRWQQSAASAQTRYTEGIASTSVDPTQLAIQAQAKMLQNLTQAVTGGRWARGLQKVGKAGWQAAAQAKANNYSTGIQASGEKYAAAIAPVLAAEAQLQAQIRAMPNVTIQDAIARSAAWQMGLHNWALSR